MADITYYVTVATFDSQTYNNASGGTLRALIDDNSQEVQTYVGDNLYPMSVEATNASCVVTLGLSEYLPTLPVMGVKSNLVLTVRKADATTEDVTLYNMKFMGQSADQSRAAAGTNDFRFVFESIDGQKTPFTAPA